MQFIAGTYVGFFPLLRPSVSFLKGDQRNNAFNFIVLPFDCFLDLLNSYTTDSIVNRTERTEVSDNKINWRHVTFINLTQQ